MPSCWVPTFAPSRLSTVEFQNLLTLSLSFLLVFGMCGNCEQVDESVPADVAQPQAVVFVANGEHS